jgi:hypothetical protein
MCLRVCVEMLVCADVEGSRAKATYKLMLSGLYQFALACTWPQRHKGRRIR